MPSIYDVNIPSAVDIENSRNALENSMLQRDTNHEMRNLYTQAQGDTSKMMELAKGSKLFALVAPQIHAQAAAQQKAQLDAQKTQSEISKNQSDAYSTMQKGQGFGLDNAGKVQSTLNMAMGYGAQTGSKDAIAHGLDIAKNAGMLTQEQYNSTVQQLAQLDTPDKVKQFAQSVQIGSSQNPAQYNVQTANNIADNQTSIANNQANNATTQRGQDINYKLGDAKLKQDQGQFDKTMQFKNQQEFFSQHKPMGFDVDINGRKYALLADGKAVYVTDDTGQQVKNQLKNGSNSQAEEKIRMDRIDAILPEIENILPKSTHSYIGKGVDIAGNLFGASTKGQQASAQLKTLSGQLVSLMPKMSGPQSDKDVAMYKEMAGNLADDSLPIKVRLAAIESIKNLNNKYRSMSNPPIGKIYTQSDVIAYSKSSGKSVNEIKQKIIKSGGTIQ